MIFDKFSMFSTNVLASGGTNTNFGFQNNKFNKSITRSLAKILIIELMISEMLVHNKLSHTSMWVWNNQITVCISDKINQNFLVYTI